MTNAISVKDRLKKQAIEDGKTMQDKLVTYGLERTIYRLSVSNYVERFTLKGGIFLYALFNGEYARATMDIDLLAQRIPNDAEEMKKVFNDIFSIECDDALRFDLNTLEVINITEFKEYISNRDRAEMYGPFIMQKKRKEGFRWLEESQSLRQ